MMKCVFFLSLSFQNQKQKFCCSVSNCTAIYKQKQKRKESTNERLEGTAVLSLKSIRYFYNYMSVLCGICSYDLCLYYHNYFHTYRQHVIILRAKSNHLVAFKNAETLRENRAVKQNPSELYPSE